MCGPDTHQPSLSVQSSTPWVWHPAETCQLGPETNAA